MSNKTKVHLMLDFETLDNVPTAHILSASLVRFDPMTGEEIKNPYYNLDNRKFGVYKQDGATIGQSTLEWWLRTDREYFNDLSIAINDKYLRNGFAGRGMLFDWLVDVCKFLNTFDTETQEIVIWNTGNFDFNILKSAFNRYGFTDNPLRYWMNKDVRVCRTLCKEFNLLDEEPETTHNAYEDCLRQIKYVTAVYKALGEK